MLDIFRQFLIRHPRLFGLWCRLLTWFGNLMYRQPLLQNDIERIEFVRGVIRPGDAIGTTGPYFTSILPGYYDHSLLYVGKGWCIEATAEGVHKILLVDVLRKEDHVQVRRPHQPFNWKRAVHAAFTMLGEQYNFAFARDEMLHANNMKAKYCHRLVAESWTIGGCSVTRNHGDYFLFADEQDVSDKVVEI